MGQQQSPSEPSLVTEPSLTTADSSPSTPQQPGSPSQRYTFFEIFHNLPIPVMRQVMLMINPPWLIPSRAATDLAEDMPFGSLGMLPPEIYAAFVADLDRIITQICQVMPEMRREPAHQYSLFDLHMPVYTPSSGVVRQQAAEVAHAIWLRLQARDVEGH